MQVLMIPEVQEIHKPVSERRNGHNVISFPDCGSLTTKNMLYQAIATHMAEYHKRPQSVTVSYGRFVETAKSVAGSPLSLVYGNDKCPLNEIWLEV